MQEADPDGWLHAASKEMVRVLESDWEDWIVHEHGEPRLEIEAHLVILQRNRGDRFCPACEIV
jgi:hypothetical protein